LIDEFRVVGDQQNLSADILNSVEQFQEPGLDLR
jgi:hypothetical protein